MASNEQRTLMALAGFPPVARWPPGLCTAVESLGRAWQIELWPCAARPGRAQSAKLDAVERLYRSADARVFARNLGAPRLLPCTTGTAARSEPAVVLAWDFEAASTVAPSCSAHCLWIEFGDHGPWQVTEAVRASLGVPGGTLEVRVCVLSSDGTEKVAFLASCSLEHRSLSRSVNSCATKVPELLRAALCRLTHRATLDAASPDSGLQPGVPAPLSSTRQLLRLGGALIERLLSREQWHLSICANWSESGTSGTTDLGPRWIRLQPPDAAFWADPFVVKENGRILVYFEELPFSSGRGHICVAELDEHGRQIGPARIALREEWHLSYPFLWQEGNRLFMIPESSGHGALELYERIGAVHEWTHRATLLSGIRLADATVVRFQGRLWMFATQADRGASLNDSLAVFWADCITGPWHPHLLNPVKVAARNSRPAGAMWIENEVLHRVVQDCSSIYGGQVRCMRVEALTPDTFVEREVRPWPPSLWFAAARWHTFNRCDTVVVVDVLKRRIRW